MRSILEALPYDNWEEVLKLLQMFKAQGRGAITDEANWLIALIEREMADFLIG